MRSVLAPFSKHLYSDEIARFHGLLRRVLVSRCHSAKSRLTKQWAQHPKSYGVRTDLSEIAGPKGVSSGEGFARVSRRFGHSPCGRIHLEQRSDTSATNAFSVKLGNQPGQMWHHSTFVRGQGGPVKWYLISSQDALRWRADFAGLSAHPARPGEVAGVAAGSDCNFKHRPACHGIQLGTVLRIE